MHQKNIRWLIALLAIATCGILLLQTYWVMHAYTVTRKQLEQNVKDAMIEVVAQLEKKEEVNFISDKLSIPVLPELPENNPAAMIPVPASPPQIPELPEHLSELSSTLNKMKSAKGEDQLITIINIDSSMHDNSRRSSGSHVNKSVIRIEHSHSRTGNGPTRSSQSIYILKDSATSLNKKAGELKNVINKLVFELEDKKQDINRRVQPDTLFQLLGSAFTKRNIDNDYSTGIFSHSINKTTPETKHEFVAQLFPNDIFSQKSYLWVDLYHPAWQVMKGMWLPLGLSAFFALFIICVFYLSVKTILKQKKLSDMKNDFINNMTHELKTPIATISIATDALNIDNSKERVSHYTSVIREENDRMNRHIEQVLQMSLLEKKELELNKVAIDMNDLIIKVARSFDLPLEAKKGQIGFKLHASDSTVLADPHHLTNVLNNLLDNAIKYSMEAPDITISSANQDDHIIVTVSDKGKGMSKEAQKHIFDKFFRVSSGNVHDVKGFGLGLSYVKTIIEAHKGIITVTSEENEGSHFTIQLKTLS